MPKTVCVQTGRDLDAPNWRRSHDAGVLPSAMPYGLDVLDEFGFNVTHRPPLHGSGARLAAKVARGLGHRWDWWATREVARDDSADLNLCWDERSGIPTAALRRSASPPVVTGVIWLTDEPALRHRASQHVIKGALQRCAAVWALSSAQLPLLHQHLGIPHDRLFRLPFGIDVEFWTPTKAGMPVPGSVLAVGNDRDRDHALVARSLTTLVRSGQARLRLATSLAISAPADVAEVLGTVTHTALRDLYAEASVVAMASAPNLHVSGMTTVLEAQAMGRPVVASRTPGMADYVIDGETGILVEPGDEDAFRSAVSGLLADPDRRAEMGRAGRSFVLERASTRTQAAALADLIGQTTGLGNTLDHINK